MLEALKDSIESPDGETLHNITLEGINHLPDLAKALIRKYLDKMKDGSWSWRVLFPFVCKSGDIELVELILTHFSNHIKEKAFVTGFIIAKNFKNKSLRSLLKTQHDLRGASYMRNLLKESIKLKKLRIFIQLSRVILSTSFNKKAFS